MPFTNLLKQTNSLIYEVDVNKENWGPNFISASVEELTGYKSDEFLFLKVSWKDLIHPEDRETVFNDAQVLSSPGVQLIQVYRIQHKDGSLKFVRDIKYSHVENGILKISGIVIDVTTFQLAYRENLKKIEELMQKNNELSKCLEKYSTNTISDGLVKATSDANLSIRENEVLELISQGKLYKIVAFELGISTETVKTHVKNIRKKLANQQSV